MPSGFGGEPRDRLIVALDVPTLGQAQALVRELSPHVGAFKVGLELCTAAGSGAVVQAIHELGGRVFYDGKFNDIPNTVAGAVRAVAGLGVWLFDVHASAGPEALRAAVAYRGESLVVAVTVLTSLGEGTCERIFGAGPQRKVVEFARMAAEAGADGVVCSPLELGLLREDPELRSLGTVVPGIRPAWAEAQDQRRVMTPGEAIRGGASAIVVGRPIVHPPSGVGAPAQAARLIVREIEEALAG